MGWQENRRRKRWWYLRYKWVAEDLARTIAQGATLADILLVVHRHTERGRHYGSGFRARSAVESINLVSADLALRDQAVVLVQPTMQNGIPVRTDPAMPISQVQLQTRSSIAAALARAGIDDFKE